MTSLIRLPSPSRSRIKAGLTLIFLISQMPLQAAPVEPVPPDSGNSEPVIVSTDKNKKPKTHREQKRGLVQPEKYPTKPQQQIRNLR